MLQPPVHRTPAGCAAIRAFGLASTAAAALAAAAAAAAEPPVANRGELGDVIITAGPRAAPVQATALAVTAFSADGLERRGITAPVDLVRHVPGLIGSRSVALGSAATYYIRGLGSTETLATSDPAVLTYLDGVPISRQAANSFGFFDVERIEVLRGPQGTSFGRASDGGAIRLATRAPGDKIEGYIEGTYGAYNNRGGRASLNIPFSPDVAIKLSGFYQNDAGYVRNVTTGERLNDSDGAGGRVAVRLRFSDAFSWNGAVSLIRSKADNLLNFDCNPANPAVCGGRFASTGLTRTTRSYAPLAISGRKAEFGLGNEANTAVYSSTFEYAGDSATLSVITGYVDLRQQYAVDLADGRPLPTLADPVPGVRGFALGGATSLNDSSSRQFTQEVRLAGRLFGDRVDYVVGGFLLRETNRTDLADIATTGAAPQLLADRRIGNSTDSAAVFAQADWRVTERLSVSAGVRYTDETRSLTVADNRTACLGSTAPACVNPGSLVAASGLAIPMRQKTRQTTPRFAVSYAVRPDLRLIASATRGFRGGGWNGRALTGDALLPFGAETVWSYEAGVRSDWFGKRLRANLTAFLLDADNFQVGSAQRADDGTLRFATANVGGYRNKGVELELAAVPIPGLTLATSLTWQDAGYRVARGGAGVDRFGSKSVAQQQFDCLAQLAAGRVPLAPGAANAADCASGIIAADGGIARPVRTPRVSLVASASYDWPIPAAGIILTPSASLDYRSAHETDSGNATLFAGAVSSGGSSFPANPFGGAVISGSRTASYVLVDAALTLRTDDNNWTLAMACSNCLDRAVVESAVAGTSYLNVPRRWQLRLKRVF